MPLCVTSTGHADHTEDDKLALMTQVTSIMITEDLEYIEHSTGPCNVCE